MPGFGLIVLAAGASTRLGRPKQLLAYGSRSLLRHIAEEAVASVCRPVLVVLGAEAARIQSELDGLPVGIVENADWERGMGASVRAGVGALGDDVDGAVLLVCDQPRVTRQVIDDLAAAATRTDSPLAACEYGGTLGVPALFRRALFPELLALDDSRGAKPLLRRYASLAARVPFAGGAQDIDTPEDAEGLNELPS